MSDFTIKDSGARAEFAGGMVRDVEDDKVDYTLITDGPMFERWAEHLTKGAKKYAPRNWMKAQGDEEYERFRRSAFRHFMQWFNGNRDEDHAAAVFFNINGAEYVGAKPSLKVFPTFENPETFLASLNDFADVSCMGPHYGCPDNCPDCEANEFVDELVDLGPITENGVVTAVVKGDADLLAEDYNYLRNRVVELTSEVNERLDIGGPTNPNYSKATDMYYPRGCANHPYAPEKSNDFVRDYEHAVDL